MTRKLIIVGVITMLALSGCKPIDNGLRGGGKAEASSDPCSAPGSIERQECWVTAGPPGTGQHAAEQPAIVPGSVRVIVAVSTFDKTAGPLPMQVHLLAQARSRSGAIGVDAKTGNPWVRRDAITSPDVVPYDLAPGLLTLDVNLITLTQPGNVMITEVTVNGRKYVAGHRSVSAPGIDPLGPSRPIMITLHIELI